MERLRLVSTVGVNDLVIVETKDAVLVAHKSQVQNVKKIVNKLKDDGRGESVDHREGGSTIRFIVAGAIK